MTITRLTKEQQQQLITRLQESDPLNPGVPRLQVFEAVIKELGLGLKISHATQVKYYQKAGLSQPRQPKQVPQEQLPPEVAILNLEKGIQEQVRRLVARRDELSQQVLHLDNLISKYKAVR